MHVSYYIAWLMYMSIVFDMLFKTHSSHNIHYDLLISAMKSIRWSGEYAHLSN